LLEELLTRGCRDWRLGWLLGKKIYLLGFGFCGKGGYLWCRSLGGVLLEKVGLNELLGFFCFILFVCVSKIAWDSEISTSSKVTPIVSLNSIFIFFFGTL
jgi:hypothetical protein